MQCLTQKQRHRLSVTTMLRNNIQPMVKLFIRRRSNKPHINQYAAEHPLNNFNPANGVCPVTAPNHRSVLKNRLYQRRISLTKSGNLQNLRPIRCTRPGFLIAWEKTSAICFENHSTESVQTPRSIVPSTLVITDCCSQ